MSHLIKASDKLVCKSPAIYVSSQVFYDKELYAKAAKQIKFIKKSLKFYKALISLPKGITFRLGSVKGSVNGYYVGKSKVLGLDVKLLDYALVLSHELIHASQFYTKKLNVKQGTFYWNGSKVGRKGTTFNSYRNQPWEVEAYDGQADLTRKVLEAMMSSNVDF